MDNNAVRLNFSEIRVDLLIKTPVNNFDANYYNLSVRFELKLLRRSLLTRRRGLARFTSGAAVAGIAAGVASLIFAQALGRGFQSEMQGKILANTAHISIFSLDEDTAALEHLSAKIAAIPGVLKITPSAAEHVIVYGPAAGGYALLITRDSGDPPDSGEPAITIGSELANKIGAVSGDTVDLITFGQGGQPRTNAVRVAGIFQTGLFEYDSTWIKAAPLTFARLAGEQQFRPRSLNLSVDDIYATDVIAGRIAEATGPRYRVLDWREANAPLFAALALERKGAIAILSLIVLIAALNITTTLALIVNARRLDIAILRTCGARGRSVVAMFVLDGLILGGGGTLIGLLVGIGGSFLANYFRLISLNPEVYSLNRIPLKPDFGDIGVIVFGVITLSIASTLYPALMASRVKPMDNLRNQ